MNESPLTEEKILELFKDAFSTNFGTCSFECACGVTYFNNELAHIEEGERILEEYRQLAKAEKPYVEVDVSIGTYIFSGEEYVDCCDCIKQNEELKSWINGVSREWKGWLKFMVMVHKEEKNFYDSRHRELLYLLGER